MKLPNIFEKEVTPLSFSAGSVIFAEGQKRDSMYVVKSGAVELNVRDKNVEVVGTDGFFGESYCQTLFGQLPAPKAQFHLTLLKFFEQSQNHFDSWKIHTVTRT
jgi:CRP-like cAMP-binding protein